MSTGNLEYISTRCYIQPALQWETCRWTLSSAEEKQWEMVLRKIPTISHTFRNPDEAKSIIGGMKLEDVVLAEVNHRDDNF